MKSLFRFLVFSLIAVFIAACGSGGGGGASSLKSAVVSWTANKEAAVNTMGGGYKVYYSEVSGFSINDKGVTTVDVAYVSGSSAPISTTLSLSPSTYYLRIAAYSAVAGGSSSAVSSQISVKTISE